MYAVFVAVITIMKASLGCLLISMSFERFNNFLKASFISSSLHNLTSTKAQDSSLKL